MRKLPPFVVAVAAFALLSALSAIATSPRTARAQLPDSASAVAPAPAPSASQKWATFTPIDLPPPPSTRTPTVTPKPAPDLSAYVGQPITRIRVVVVGTTWEDVVLPAVKSVVPGEKLTPEAARRALAEVLETGLFARGEV